MRVKTIKDPQTIKNITKDINNHIKGNKRFLKDRNAQKIMAEKPIDPLKIANERAVEIVSNRYKNSAEKKGHDSRNKDGGIKNDNMKPRMSLIPQAALLEIGKVMTYGAEKYADYNWMNGFDFTNLADACSRHLAAFISGEDIDPESGLHHLAHAACCAMMGLENTMIYPERDDRWKGWQTERGKVALKKAQKPYQPSEYLREFLGNKKK